MVTKEEIEVFLKEREEHMETRRKALEEALKNKGEAYHKVTSYMVRVGELDVAIGYFVEPNRFTKMKAMDLISQSLSEAGDMIMAVCLLPESDPRISDGKPENDTLYMTFLEFAYGMVKTYVSVVKKN